jgi:hypothetical protein
VIASKNVGLLARNREDIKLYTANGEGDRFYFASLMANVWFDILESFSEEVRNQMIKDISGKTLVGEYIGS